jgi:hypothetical protein
MIEKGHTVTFGNSMMQRRLSRHIRSINWTFILNQQLNYRHGTHGRSPVDGVLASFVFYAG